MRRLAVKAEVESAEQRGERLLRESLEQTTFELEQGECLYRRRKKEREKQEELE